jgi:hypothetical protein
VVEFPARAIEKAANSYSLFFVVGCGIGVGGNNNAVQPGIGAAGPFLIARVLDYF